MVKISRILLIHVLLFSTTLMCEAQDISKNNFANNWHGFDGAMNRYADSLNLANNKDQLPSFLNDYLLDWKWRNLWQRSLESKEGLISYRKLIIDRVCRQDVLEWIIMSKNKNYDKTYEPSKLESELEPNIYNEFPDLPFMKYSIRSLAKMRLNEIKNYKSNNHK